MRVDFSTRDKESVMHALEAAERERDRLLEQDSRWEELQHTAEKVEALTKLIGQVDSEELQDLKRVKDRFKNLEGEHTALQKRYREQETKLANVERASQVARQTLGQAQHRSSEWESKAKEYQSDLARVNLQLDEVEQSRSQLEADLSLARLQLEEKEADERMSQVKCYHLVLWV